jgi:hypothetical protein
MWSEGEHVRFRYVREQGRPFWTLPVTVAADGPEENALWIAPASPMVRPSAPRVGVEALAAGTWDQVESTWAGEGVLMLRRPAETRHAIWLFWHADSTFRGWYVNLEDWWRTPEGLDAYDHQLDIWVDAEGQWRWKDEDDLADSVAAGLYSAERAAAIRAEGERVLAEWPFPTGWEDWRPDPSWELPALPDRWDAV